MPTVRFTQNIQRHVTCPDDTVGGRSVRDVLDAYFARHDGVRGYVLDDQGSLRKHMNVFVNGALVRDRQTLADDVPDDGTIDVMQALSGG